MPYANPPAAPTISGDLVTASRFLQSTPLISRALRTLAQQRLIGLTVFTGRSSTTSGSLQVEGSESIYTDRPVEVVSPGAEYPFTTMTSGPISQVSTNKWGQQHEFFDEAVSRQNWRPVDKGMNKLMNSAEKNIDSLCLSLLASSVTQTQGTAGTGNWSGSNPTILRDILRAKATIAALNQGYNPDLLITDDLTWASIASDPTLTNALRRENPANPVYSGELNTLAGVRIVATPNLPVGAPGAWLIDSSQFGGIVTEKIASEGYVAAGDFLEMKRIPTDNDSTIVRVRSVWAPYVEESAAAIRIVNAQ